MNLELLLDLGIGSIILLNFSVKLVVKGVKGLSQFGMFVSGSLDHLETF